MLSLIAVAIYGAWVYLSYAIARRLFTSSATRRQRRAKLFGTFMLLACLPFIDEIINWPFFQQQCRIHAGKSYVDPVLAPGSRLIFESPKPQHYSAPFADVRIEEHLFKLADSGKVVIRNYKLYIGGGFLVRSLGLFEMDGPMLQPAQCVGFDFEQIKRKLNVSVIN